MCSTLLCCLALAGCKSAAQHRVDADRQVYEIIRERRDELAGGGEFDVERPADTLRARILADEGFDDTTLDALTLVDCLVIASENSRGFQTRREALYLAALDLTLERWRFSVQETGTFGAFLSGDGDGASDTGIFSNLGLRRLLASGASIIGDIGFDLGRNIASADGWSAVTSFSLNITQPILRGFGRDIVREPLTQAERDVLYEARRYERFRRTFAFDVASRFYRVLQQLDNLRNQETNRDGLTLLRERNEAFAEAGRLSDIQVDQARQDELRAENRVVDARRELEGSLDDFKLFLGLPPDVPLDPDASELERLDDQELFAKGVGDEIALAVALDERLDHLTAIDGVEDAERQSRVRADALRMGLDLDMNASGTGRSNRPLDYRSSDIDWTAQLTLDLPLDRLPERNEYRASLITLEAARRSAEESADSISADLRDAKRELEAAERTHDIQTGAVVLADRRVQSATLNLEAGRASTRDLLEAQESLLDARIATTGAQIDRLLASLALFRDMGLLRVSPQGIDVALERLAPQQESP